MKVDSRYPVLLRVTAGCLLALLSFWCLSRLSSVSAPAVHAQTHSNASPTKRALLVGINTYEHSDRISPLSGSLNDVDDMRQLLIGKFEFAPENIVVLKDSQATHAGIMSAIQTELIAKTQPGDIVVFHYSGHGSQMKDTTGKRISGLDETIVPYDSRDPEGKVADISGAELHVALVQLAARTKNLTFILDSCHSGTLVRGAKVRFIPTDTRNLAPTALPVERGAVSADDGRTPSFAFLSAATSKENAFEHFANGQDHGAFTHFLTSQLRSANAGATYRDVMDAVIANVTANYPGQHPSLEGAEADQHVFGDSSSLAGVYVSASPSALDARRVTLSIGQVQGATAGSVYDVYAPGTKRFSSPERPVARVQLAKVDALTSDAVVVSGGKVSLASRAVEREHKYGNARTRVYFDGLASSPTLQSIHDALVSAPFVEIVETPTRCNVQLRQVGQSIVLVAADGSTLSPPVPIADKVDDRILGQLKLWAKWFKVLSIANAQSPTLVNFTLSGSQTRDPVARIGKPDMGVADGETIDATVVNNSDRDLYIALLDLSTDGSITVIYPTQQGVAAVLKPHDSLSNPLRVFVPKGRSKVMDVLKVFASYKPIDLTPLTQGRVRDADTNLANLDPLQELLLDSTEATRNAAPLLTTPVELGSWAVVSRSLLVGKKN